MTIVKSLRQIGQACESLEGVLNILGYIPIVGTLSALIRFFYGKVQVFGGLIVLLISLVASIFGRPAKKRTWKHALELGGHFIRHGFLNYGRSLVEFIPFLPLITCLPYDRLGTKILDYEIR